MSRVAINHPGPANPHAPSADPVCLAPHGQPSEPGIADVSGSWRRSATEFHLDPESHEAPRILTSREVAERRESLDELVFSAQDELDRLYGVVGAAGYTLLFCDAAGIAVDHRGDDSDADRFRHWGTWLGGVWDEAIEGTNGIGTCINEERPVTVHRNQHYRKRHADLSCSGAPIFGADGRLMAVLDVSAIDPERSERAHALTGALTFTSARAIEERFFRECFRREWIVATAKPENCGSVMLLAIDPSQRIIGANRAARSEFLLDAGRLQAGSSLWSLFERDQALFRRQDYGDIATRLTIAGSTEIWPALVTPPDRGSDRRQNSRNLAFHTRPRSDALIHLPMPACGTRARGGLPPAVMRRVCDHIDAHLGDAIELVELATIAGLSIFHFARQFKHSVGMTPHHYHVSRRIARAKELLEKAQLSLSEIAFTVGFADQSHLSRHFRQIVGTSPGQFRRALRDTLPLVPGPT
jgi:AraC-like DNA-binding protein